MAHNTAYTILTPGRSDGGVTMRNPAPPRPVTNTMPAPRASDSLSGSILLFRTFSVPMLMPKPSRPYSPLQPRKAKAGLNRLLLVNKVLQHRKQDCSQGGYTPISRTCAVSCPPMWHLRSLMECALQMLRMYLQESGLLPSHLSSQPLVEIVLRPRVLPQACRPQVLGW